MHTPGTCCWPWQRNWLNENRGPVTPPTSNMSINSPSASHRPHKILFSLATRWRLAFSLSQLCVSALHPFCSRFIIQMRLVLSLRFSHPVAYARLNVFCSPVCTCICTVQGTTRIYTSFSDLRTRGPKSKAKLAITISCFLLVQAYRFITPILK